MPITILDYVKSVVGDKDLYTAEDCLASGVDILGGCQGCQAIIACYNAYPSTTGYWRCADCIGETGFATVADFTAQRPRSRPARPAGTPTPSAKPASPPASAPRSTRWNAATAARSGSHDTAAGPRMAERHLRHPPPPRHFARRLPQWQGPIDPADVNQASWTPVRTDARRPGRLPRPRTVVAMTTDHRQHRTIYALLGVRPGATTAQIKTAYRKLAKQYHPDVNNSPDAAERFREITEAYDTLTDPDRRRRYDRLHGTRTGTPPARDGTWSGYTSSGNGHARRNGSANGNGSQAASRILKVLEDIWLEIRRWHPEIPPAVIIIASGTDGKQTRLGPPRPRPLERRRRAVHRDHDQRRRTTPQPARGPRHPPARSRPRPGPRTRHQGHLPPGPLPQQALQDPRRRTRPDRRATTTATAGPPATITPATELAYARQLDALTEAMTLWRHGETITGPTARRNTNLIAAICPCGRSIRVAASTLAEAPITCQACDEDFQAKNAD